MAGATLVPIAALLWLGARILQQERDVARQRARESLEVAAGRLAISMDRRLAEFEEKLTRGEGLRFNGMGISGSADAWVLYQPQAASAAGQEPDPSIFSAAEAEEFQHGNLLAAAAAYEKLASSPDGGVRAGALVRRARVLRKRGDGAGALRVYEALQQLGRTPIGGDLAELIGRQGRARIFEEAGDAQQLREEAVQLARVLYSGLPIDRAAFEFYADLVRRWGAPPPPAEAMARTEAATQLWRLWRSGELPLRGRRMLRENAAPVLAVWDDGACGWPRRNSFAGY